MKSFRKPAPRPKKKLLIAGISAVEQALREGRALERIYLQMNIGASSAARLLELARQHQVPVNKVPVEKLNTFNLPEHNGCIAQLARVQYQDLQQIIDFVVERGEAPLFLMLDGITDIRNIGGIARSAYAMGVHALIIPQKGVGTLNDDAILTSAGALEQLPVCRVPSLVKAADDLHLNGIRLIATVMNAPQTIAETNLTEPVAIVMGSEEKGIQPTLLKVCDEQCSIPMAGTFDSLNVSVSTGIVLYEVLKQRNKQA